jgi:hypothetical protein
VREIQVPTLLVVVGLTLLSGLGDAQGFLHAARMWQAGRLVAAELGRSAAGFAVGIGAYWICVRYLQRVGVEAPETQTLVWFVTTLLGVALVSGDLFRWRALDQAVAALVCLGIGWLLFRTG